MKDHEQFFEQLRGIPANLYETFQMTISHLFTYEEGIQKAMISPYFNGKL